MLIFFMPVDSVSTSSALTIEPVLPLLAAFPLLACEDDILLVEASSTEEPPLRLLSRNADGISDRGGAVSAVVFGLALVFAIGFVPVVTLVFFTIGGRVTF